MYTIVMFLNDFDTMKLGHFLKSFSNFSRVFGVSCFNGDGKIWNM